MGDKVLLRTNVKNWRDMHAAGQAHRAAAPNAAAAQGYQQPSAIVFAKNNSSGDLAIGDIAGVSGSLSTHASNSGRFLRNPALTLADPTYSDHRFNFAVCIDPIKVGGAGRVAVAGIVPVKVKYDPAYHRGVEVEDGNTTSLIGSVLGGSQVVSIDAGTVTDERWAYVRIGQASGDLFIVDCIEDGNGDAGGKTTKCSFAYDLEVNSVSIATGLSPEFEFRTATGRFVAGTKGTAYYHTDGTIKLWQVNEVAGSGECS